MEIRNKKILIYGLGISGKGLAAVLNRTHADMVLYDDRENLDKEALLSELQLSPDTPVILGHLEEKDLKDIDIVAISPGVSIHAPNIQMARQLGKEILGELEIAYELSQGKVIAITGTNGKTTTTALVGEIMKAVYKDVHVVGNIGISYASVALDTTPDSVIVAEVSSFQLESIRDFHPAVSAVLNITPDHLDRHGTFENYALCKMEIAKNQTGEEKCIVNFDDPYLRQLSQHLMPEPLYFSRLEKLDKGVFLEDDLIVYSDGITCIPIMKKQDMNLMGDHNVENVMAAIAMSITAGVPARTIARVVKNFKAVEHRIEYVRTVKDVAYYNDSKGTNTDASDKAIHAMIAPCVLIAGGYDKGADFTDWIRSFDGKVKALVLIGKTAPKIRETAINNGFEAIHMAGDLENAVRLSAQIAAPGDCVLLSPACASWDQFKSYEERGRIFKELVGRL